MSKGQFGAGHSKPDNQHNFGDIHRWPDAIRRLAKSLLASNLPTTKAEQLTGFLDSPFSSKNG